MHMLILYKFINKLNESQQTHHKLKELTIYNILLEGSGIGPFIFESLGMKFIVSELYP